MRKHQTVEGNFTIKEHTQSLRKQYISNPLKGRPTSWENNVHYQQIILKLLYNNSKHG